MPDEQAQLQRIAMWSGPRNISTAMMRAWGSRSDTFVCDEPLYAHYLQQTGLPHPGAEETIAAHETDWRKVVDWLCGPIPDGKVVFYQKQMAHHLLSNIDEGWMDGLTNCFLIREPAAVVKSLVEFIPQPVLTDTGMPQQVRIFRRELARTGRIPPVMDAADVLRNPRQMLGKLCDLLRLPFQEQMLSWQPGTRSTDGIWARHWYAKVYQTSGFQAYESRTEEVSSELRPLVDECQELYRFLYQHRIM